MNAFAGVFSLSPGDKETLLNDIRLLLETQPARNQPVPQIVVPVFRNPPGILQAD